MSNIKPAHNAQIMIYVGYKMLSNKKKLITDWRKACLSKCNASEIRISPLQNDLYYKNIKTSCRIFLKKKFVDGR